jgi:hypothetical protein
VRPLDRDERVVSWATADSGTVVATQRGLWLPDPDDPDGPRRIPWHLVDKAIWRAGTLTLIVAVDTGGGVLAEQRPRSVRLTEPRDLPPTVRVRVERSIGYTRHHRLVPAGGVRVVGRRVAGRDGLSWQLVFDADTDPDDPLLRIQADRLVAQARAETGAPP